MNKKFPREVKTSITEELYQRLQALCNHKGRKSHLVRQAIEKMVDDEETRRKNMKIMADRF